MRGGRLLLAMMLLGACAPAWSQQPAGAEPAQAKPAAAAESAKAEPAGPLVLRDGVTVHPPKPALFQGFRYVGTSDTTLSPAQPNYDFGGCPTLTLRPGAERVLIRFDQLLTSIGGPYWRVNDATITLILQDPPAKLPDPATIHVCRVKRSWNEGGREASENYWAATWLARYHSRRPNVITWNASGLESPADAEPLPTAKVAFVPVKVKLVETDAKTGQPHETEVERMALQISGLGGGVQDFLSRQWSNFGWLLRWDDEHAAPDAALSLVSREAPAAERNCRPTLTVTYARAPRSDYTYDLGVLYISRFPEYFAWLDTGRDGENGGYERKPFHGQPGNGILKKPAFWDTPKNPQPGDTVWYVARVKNHGPQALPAGCRYEWRLNDTVIKTGELPEEFPPDTEKELWIALPFPDRMDDHRDEFLTLHVTPRAAESAALPPENENNNERTIYTKARATGVVADETAREFYLRYDNAWGTRNFEDWIQFQMDYWNDVYMAKSRFRDLFPDGAVTRVRVQRAFYVRPGVLAGGVHIPYDLRQPQYDGMWGWDFSEVREHPEKLADPEFFCRQTLGMVEPSLIHEMSHQCFGLIDIYWMNMEAANNADTGEGGKVRVRDVEHPGKFLTGIGYGIPDGGLMGGGDTRYSPQHEGSDLYSSHSVGGLNYNAPYRGGFFGDYIYDVPEHVTLCVTTPDGRPAADAEIKIWQSNYGWEPPKSPIDDKDNNADVYFEGRLGPDGTLLLPNQPTGEDAPFTTLTNHTLRPNIFGRINVVAFNGNMLIRVHWEGKYYYHFLTLWELNVVYWKGHRGEFRYPLVLTPDKLPGPDFKVGRHSDIIW